MTRLHSPLSAVDAKDRDLRIEKAVTMKGDKYVLLKRVERLGTDREKRLTEIHREILFGELRDWWAQPQGGGRLAYNNPHR